jgi:hypothetical protein
LLDAHLQIETLAGLHKLGLLAVLNASKNSLTHIEGIARLGKLKALILNDNKLKRIPHLAKLAELNTLGMDTALAFSDGSQLVLFGADECRVLIKLCMSRCMPSFAVDTGHCFFLL